MQKVDGVASVKVSLKDGLTVLDLKPSNTVRLARLREIIKNNGFVSREAEIVATGAATDDSTSFIVAGTSERLPVQGRVTTSGPELWRFTSPSK